MRVQFNIKNKKIKNIYLSWKLVLRQRVKIYSGTHASEQIQLLVFPLGSCDPTRWIIHRESRSVVQGEFRSINREENLGQ